MENIDVNFILSLIAEGKLTEDQVNYILNTAARFNERTHKE